MCYQTFNSFHLVPIILQPTLIKQFNSNKYIESQKENRNMQKTEKQQKIN